MAPSQIFDRVLNIGAEYTQLLFVGGSTDSNNRGQLGTVQIVATFTIFVPNSKTMFCVGDSTDSNDFHNDVLCWGQQRQQQLSRYSFLIPKRCSMLGTVQIATPFPIFVPNSKTMFCVGDSTDSNNFKGIRSQFQTKQLENETLK